MGPDCQTPIPTYGSSRKLGVLHFGVLGNDLGLIGLALVEGAIGLMSMWFRAWAAAKSYLSSGWNNHCLPLATSLATKFNKPPQDSSE